MQSYQSFVVDMHVEEGRHGRDRNVKQNTCVENLRLKYEAAKRPCFSASSRHVAVKVQVFCKLWNWSKVTQFYLPSLWSIPVGTAAERAAWQSMREETGTVRAATKSRTAHSITSRGTWVILLNGQRLVWAIQSRSWNGQDKWWRLDGHR